MNPFQIIGKYQPDYFVHGEPVILIKRYIITDILPELLRMAGNLSYFGLMVKFNPLFFNDVTQDIYCQLLNFE